MFRKHKLLRADYEKLQTMYTEAESELLRLREMEKEHQLIDRILTKDQITGVVFNRKGIKQYICLRTYDASIDIMLRSIHSRPPHPRLYAKIQEDYSTGRQYGELIDIFAEGENAGNGTVLLQSLFSYLNQLGISEVRGMLSSADKDSFDKLEYFYKKNGFDVMFNEHRTSGRILLNL